MKIPPQLPWKLHWNNCIAIPSCCKEVLGKHRLLKVCSNVFHHLFKVHKRLILSVACEGTRDAALTCSMTVLNQKGWVSYSRIDFCATLVSILKFRGSSHQAQMIIKAGLSTEANWNSIFVDIPISVHLYIKEGILLFQFPVKQARFPHFCSSTVDVCCSNAAGLRGNYAHSTYLCMFTTPHSPTNCFYEQLLDLCLFMDWIENGWDRGRI